MADPMLRDIPIGPRADSALHRDGVVGFRHAVVLHNIASADLAIKTIAIAIRQGEAHPLQRMEFEGDAAGTVAAGDIVQLIFRQLHCFGLVFFHKNSSFVF